MHVPYAKNFYAGNYIKQVYSMRACGVIIAGKAEREKRVRVNRIR
jgi:hypothetical protein